MTESVLENVYSRLRPNQRRAIDSLLKGEDKAAAAVAADVSYRTIDRWHHDPEFRAALNIGGDMALKDAALRLKASLDTAVGVMRAVMVDPETPKAVQLRAADLVASHTPKLAETADLIERLEALEAKLNQ